MSLHKYSTPSIRAGWTTNSMCSRVSSSIITSLSLPGLVSLPFASPWFGCTHNSGHATEIVIQVLIVFIGGAAFQMTHRRSQMGYLPRSQCRRQAAGEGHLWPPLCCCFPRYLSPSFPACRDSLRPGRPLDCTILGWKANILFIKRDDLTNYIRTNYTADCMVFVGAGGIKKHFPPSPPPWPSHSPVIQLCWFQGSHPRRCAHVTIIPGVHQTTPPMLVMRFIMHNWDRSLGTAPLLFLTIFSHWSLGYWFYPGELHEPWWHNIFHAQWVDPHLDSSKSNTPRANSRPACFSASTEPPLLQKTLASNSSPPVAIWLQNRLKLPLMLWWLRRSSSSDIQILVNMYLVVLSW